MNDIRFWYPAAKRTGSERSNSKQKEGLIHVINLENQPYEIEIMANGYCFHTIFGKSNMKNDFLCIPNWNLGCELVSYKDRHWNINSIAHTGKISYEDACAIGNALDLLALFIKSKS